MKFDLIFAPAKDPLDRYQEEVYLADNNIADIELMVPALEQVSDMGVVKLPLFEVGWDLFAVIWCQDMPDRIISLGFEKGCGDDTLCYVWKGDVRTTLAGEPYSDIGDASKE